MSRPLTRDRLEKLEALRRHAEWAADVSSSSCSASQIRDAEFAYAKAMKAAGPELIRLAKIGLEFEAEDRAAHDRPWPPASPGAETDTGIRVR